MSSHDDPVLDRRLRRLRREVATHPVFAAIDDRDALACFMHAHVFAVWDFMSLAKRLQRDLTCVELPWLPRGDAAAARLINEIVVGEESDLGPDGTPASHLELYLAAMREIGASTHAFDGFVLRVRAGLSLENALNWPGIPGCVAAFVTHTLRTAIAGTTLEVLASFLYGREDVIPRMFAALLERWRFPPQAAPTFVYYVRRHIDLDGDAHGPAAARLLDGQLALDPARLGEARAAAHAALAARRELWDGVLALMRGGHAVDGRLAGVAG